MSKNNYTDDNLNKIGDDHVSYHFENRLFDRDTLILQTYNINFLFVLSAYVQGARQHTQRIRNVFRENVMEVLGGKEGKDGEESKEGRYKFYAMTPHEGVSASAYIGTHFQQMLGKVFAPFPDREGQMYFSLALDRDDKYAEENALLLSQLESSFYIKPCKLGTAPYDILPKVEVSTKPVLPNRLLPIHFLENYAEKSILIGGYHDQAHLDWIQGKNDKGTLIYNIRLDKTRAGHLTKAQIERYAAPIVILYHIGYPEDGYIVYHVHHNATIDQERMAKTLYPREPKGNYYCYVFDDEISIGKMDIEGLLEFGKHKMETDGGYVEGMPMFVNGDEIIEFRTAIM